MLKILFARDLRPEEIKELTLRESAQDREAVLAAEQIIDRVEKEGESAVLEYTEKFDRVKLKSLLATPEEFKKAPDALTAELRQSFEKARINIREFHELQKPSFERRQIRKEHELIGYKFLPVHGAGIYVPGGKASYPSSVLMGLVPAGIAGVRDPILITPPDSSGSVDPAVLFCANMCGCSRVLKSGGAQGIAAAAFGITGLPSAVIVGPGNRYVTAAKQILTARGVIRMDLPAGPSEVLVIADKTANAAFVAADMLSQAEHGSDSPAVLVTDSVDFAQRVSNEIEKGLSERPQRRAMKEASIRDHSFALVFDDLSAGFDFSNRYAPEHLEICTADPEKDLEKIESAGSIFLGHYSPVALGDYYSGTNHVLPTGGAAHAYSGLGVDSFMKRLTYQMRDAHSLREALDPVLEISRHEGLEHEHGHSVAVRFEKF